MKVAPNSFHLKTPIVLALWVLAVVALWVPLAGDVSFLHQQARVSGSFARNRHEDEEGDETEPPSEAQQTPPGTHEMSPASEEVSGAPAPDQAPSDAKTNPEAPPEGPDTLEGFTDDDAPSGDSQITSDESVTVDASSVTADDPSEVFTADDTPSDITSTASVEPAADFDTEDPQNATLSSPASAGEASPSGPSTPATTPVPDNVRYELDEEGEPVSVTVQAKGEVERSFYNRATRRMDTRMVQGTVPVEIFALAEDAGVTVSVNQGVRGENFVEVPVAGFDAEGTAYIPNPNYPEISPFEYIPIETLRPGGERGAAEVRVFGWSDDGRPIFDEDYRFTGGRGGIDTSLYGVARTADDTAADHPSRTDPTHPNYRGPDSPAPGAPQEPTGNTPEQPQEAISGEFSAQPEEAEMGVSGASGAEVETPAGPPADGAPENVRYELDENGEPATVTVQARGTVERERYNRGTDQMETVQVQGTVPVEIFALAEDAGVTVSVNQGVRGENFVDVPVAGFDAEGTAYIRNPNYPEISQYEHIPIETLRPGGDRGAAAVRVTGWTEDGQPLFDEDYSFTGGRGGIDTSLYGVARTAPTIRLRTIPRGQTRTIRTTAGRR